VIVAIALSAAQACATNQPNNVENPTACRSPVDGPDETVGAPTGLGRRRHGAALASPWFHWSCRAVTRGRTSMTPRQLPCC